MNTRPSSRRSAAATAPTTAGESQYPNNGTAAQPLGNNVGTAIGIGNNGFSTMTATVNNNVMVANDSFGSNGIGGGNGVVLGCGAGRYDTPT